VSDDKRDYRVGADAFWSRAWLTPLVIGIVGGLLMVLTAGPERLGYSYLFGMFAALTFMLGGLFIVLIQFMTASHWGVSSRRIPEVIMSGAPVIFLLAIPFLAGVGLHQLSLYEEWQSVGAHGDHAGEHGDGHSDDHEGHGDHEGHDEHGSLTFGASVANAQDHGDHGDHAGDDEHGEAHDEGHSHTPQETALHHDVVAQKVAYLNTGGWVSRALVYLLIWTILALAYYTWSRKQDEDGNPAHTVRMQSLAPAALILFGGTLTFASFDWLMSLEAAWFSTIFGVIIFAGSVIAILATTILIALSFYQRGLTGDAITPEHFHDLSKLMFGFVCFWTYVSFSQWMLIWYAGIPEEAIWYHRRWEGGWQVVAYLLIFGHFVAPFLLLISRVQKRALTWLQFMCFWLILMHFVDIYWFVMPQAEGGFQIADVGALLFALGLFFAFVFWRLRKVPLVPVGDPRLARSVHHHQTH
jgi:hypothetical protein